MCGAPQTDLVTCNMLVVVKVSGCQIVMMSVCQDVRVSDCHGVMVSGCQGVRLSWCQGVRLSGCHAYSLGVRFFVGQGVKAGVMLSSFHIVRVSCYQNSQGAYPTLCD